jgi:hypothetical protein
MNRIFIFLLLILIFASSCEEGQYPLKIGDNYYISHDPYGNCIIKGETNVILINSQIVAWNFDTIFIIAKQKPEYMINEIIFEKYPNIPYDKHKKIYDETDLYYYWIIDKSKELTYDTATREYTNFFGPMTYEDYWEKRIELHVSDTLKLRQAEKISFDSPLHCFLYYRFNNPRENIVE